MTDERWKLGGYAPGNYSGTCVICGGFITGDKRSTECLPCAAKVAAKRIEQLEREVVELRSMKVWSRKIVEDALKPVPQPGPIIHLHQPGCICPPTSEQTCGTQMCPRKLQPLYATCGVTA